jgi:ATP dependent DNA ligase-like protein
LKFDDMLLSPPILLPRAVEIACVIGRLYSRRKNSLNHRFDYVASALKGLPDETVIDGELVALGPGGKPSFNLLQNLRSAESHIIYYAFDILFRKGEDLTQLTLSRRREVLESVVKPSDHVGLSQVADKTSAQMLRFVRAHGLEASSQSVRTAFTSPDFGLGCGASTASTLVRSS